MFLQPIFAPFAPLLVGDNMVQYKLELIRKFPRSKLNKEVKLVKNDMFKNLVEDLLEKLGIECKLVNHSIMAKKR